MSSDKVKQQSSVKFPDSRDATELRQKLMSFGWIQCDNTSCLKWRKVRLEVAKQVTEDTPWTCDKNEDENFNSCSIPEEDTSLYDKLARSVNLNIITSKLRPGTLVWAKVAGYCRWPALVTADPLNGCHTDDDEFESLKYHVEFLGEKRSHGWVSTRSIEVFGPGNIDQPAGNKCMDPSSTHVKRGKAKKYNRLTSASRVKHKEVCQRGYKLQMAIQEALKLLLLETEERLKTCHFVSCSDVEKAVCAKRRKNGNITVFHHVKKLSPVQNLAFCDKTPTDMDCTNMTLGHRNQFNSGELSKYSHTESLKENLNGLVKKCSSQSDKFKNMIHDVSTVGEKNRNLQSEIKKPDFLTFPSNLLNSSKEERFMKDVQMYKQNEWVFEESISQFMLHNDLTLSDGPTWQNIQVSMFGLFMAVHERYGYLKTCERHLWPAVYTEVTHQHSKQGGGLAKRFYKRNLYPFELYIAGEDYTAAIRDLHRQVKKTLKKKQLASETGDSGVDIDDIKAVFDDEDDFDSPDVAKQLDELDEILKSLEQSQERENERLVPHLEGNISLMHTKDSLSLSQSANVVTGSGLGQPVEPGEQLSAVKLVAEENAQVVPFLGFSTSTESSNFNDGENMLSSPPSVPGQVLHEMQALQCDMDMLQDEIDLL